MMSECKSSIPYKTVVLTVLSDDSDDDDTAELMAELAKIKQERAEEKARLVSLAVLSFKTSAVSSRHDFSIHSLNYFNGLLSLYIH